MLLEEYNRQSFLSGDIFSVINSIVHGMLYFYKHY